MRWYWVFIFLFITGGVAHSGSPNQFGSTGLLSIPTADTLDSGNLCLGLWGNYSKNPSTPTSASDSFILPAGITLGISPFWEIYGTYPNLLFNDKEQLSGRGTADIGMKFRFWGRRNSRFKLAADLTLQRHLSEDPLQDGTVDKSARLIASIKKERVGAHAYAGYISPEAPPGRSYQDEIIYGGGVEFAPMPRMKLTAEITGNSNRERDKGYPLEGLIGMQYYLSPHLTLNLAGSAGLSSASPEWRFIFGLTTCQGVGTYIKPVPKLVQNPGKKAVQEKEIRPVKIIPLSPLLLQSSQPISHSLEIPVGNQDEEVVFRPYGEIPVATKGPDPISSRLEVPVTPFAEEIALAVKSEATAGEKKTAEESPLYAVRIDGQDVAVSGTIPAKTPAKVNIYRKFRFPDASFDYDQWSLSEQGKKYLAEIGQQIRSDKKWAYLRIDGYSDDVGSENYNMDLSLKRAISVTTYLTSREGIEPGRIFIKAMGGKKTLTDGSFPERRGSNRRCEILLLQPK